MATASATHINNWGITTWQSNLAMRNTRLKWGDRPFKWMDAGECSIDRLLGSKQNNSQVDVRRWLFMVLFKVISYFPSGKSTIWGIYRACGLWPAQAAPSRSVPEGDFLCFKTSFPMELWWCFKKENIFQSNLKLWNGSRWFSSRLSNPQV